MGQADGKSGQREHFLRASWGQRDRSSYELISLGNPLRFFWRGVGRRQAKPLTLSEEQGTSTSLVLAYWTPTNRKFFTLPCGDRASLQTRLVCGTLSVSPELSGCSWAAERSSNENACLYLGEHKPTGKGCFLRGCHSLR